MVCIYCHSKTRVTNSRSSKKHVSTWRRRQCAQCRAIFSTRERPDYEGSIRVASTSSEALEPFLRDKLFVSVFLSVSHRKTALEDASALTDTIITLLLAHYHAGIVKTSEIIETTAKILGNFDQAAATYYTAHHGVGNRN